MCSAILSFYLYGENVCGEVGSSIFGFSVIAVIILTRIKNQTKLAL
jgi:hypothetical protein